MRIHEMHFPVYRSGLDGGRQADGQLERGLGAQHVAGGLHRGDAVNTLPLPTKQTT